MSDNVAFDARFISSTSPVSAPGDTYHGGLTTSRKNVAAVLDGMPMVCGALALWAAPGLLFARFSPGQLFTALAYAPLRASFSDLLILLFAVAYLMVTGLLLGHAAERLAARWQWRPAATRILLAPMILLSLSATAVVSVPLFLALILQCVPSLL